MDYRINIDNTKVQVRQGATWVISAVKTFPILTYHALLMSWLVLVPKWCGWNGNSKWIYYIPDKLLKNESTAWNETFDQCKKDVLHNIQRCHPHARSHTSLHLPMDCGDSTNVVLQKTTDDITRENGIKPCSSRFSKIVTMSMLVKTQQAFLQLLVTSRRKQALASIKTINNQQLNAICEILINIWYGNVPVNDTVKKKLQRKKNVIQELTSKSTGAKLRKTLIEKEVGLIIYVVKLILPQLKTIV